MTRRKRTDFIHKLTSLSIFCSRRMAESGDVEEHEEWLNVKRRIDKWIEEERDRDNENSKT